MSARALVLGFAIAAPIPALEGEGGAFASSLLMPPLGDMSLRTGGGESKIANAFRFCGGTAYGLLTSKPRLARTSVVDKCRSFNGVFCGVVSLGEFPANEGGADDMR